MQQSNYNHNIYGFLDCFIWSHIVNVLLFLWWIWTGVLGVYRWSDHWSRGSGRWCRSRRILVLIRGRRREVWRHSWAGLKQVWQSSLLMERLVLKHMECCWQRLQKLLLVFTCELQAVTDRSVFDGVSEKSPVLQWSSAALRFVLFSRNVIEEDQLRDQLTHRRPEAGVWDLQRPVLFNFEIEWKLTWY